MGSLIAQGEIKAGVGQRQAGATDDARLVILVFQISEGENIYFVPCTFEGAFVQVNVIRDAADVRFVCVCHHADLHTVIVQGGRCAVKMRRCLW